MEKLLHASTTIPTPTPITQNPLPKPSPTISLPQKSPQNSKISSPSPSLPKTSPQISSLPDSSPFFQKTLYLESIGLDPLPLISSHPPIDSIPLSAIKSTVDFLRSYGFSPTYLRRIFTMCPDTLTASPSSILAVFTFLLREAKINGSDLVPAINRRPRLLVSDVARRLRPTLYFLQTLGIVEVAKHTSLLSCSVEEKFIPRLEYLQSIGFSYRDSVFMVRRFPPLFCYGIESNLEPKSDYFVFEMGRELKELREFPQYFSFSLHRRIKPRHQMCSQRGLFFPLPALLKSNDQKFQQRLEVCVSSSPPLRNSPLWHFTSDNRISR